MSNVVGKREGWENRREASMKSERQGREREEEKEGKGKGRVKVKAEGYTHADTDAEVDESGQTIVCLGCGSRWRLVHVCRASIVANLIECPLCELEPLEPKPGSSS
jgi:hypothetical protein